MNFHLEIESATADFDPETRIIFVVYRGILDGETNAQVYNWLDDLYHEIGIENVHGQVFDFRAVTEFSQDNLKTARRTSNRLNMKTDVSHFPVAMIVSDFYHEEILRGSMRVSDANIRKRIVWTDAQALAFIEEWHTTHAENN